MNFRWHTAHNFDAGRYADEMLRRMQQPAATPAHDSEYAIAGGFCGYASACGYRLELVRGADGAVTYTWRNPHGQLLKGGVQGKRSPRLFVAVCAKLAELEPEMMHWREAFRSLQLFKIERSNA